MIVFVMGLLTGSISQLIPRPEYTMFDGGQFNYISKIDYKDFIKEIETLNSDTSRYKDRPFHQYDNYINEEKGWISLKIPIGSRSGGIEFYVQNLNWHPIITIITVKSLSDFRYRNLYECDMRDAFVVIEEFEKRFSDRFGLVPCKYFTIDVEKYPKHEIS